MNESHPDIQGTPGNLTSGLEPETYIWLLHKEESRAIWLCFLLSTFVHVIIFLVLAATRIFHPFAGDTGEINFVWLISPSSPGAGEGLKQPTAQAEKVSQAEAHTPPAVTEKTAVSRTEPASVSSGKTPSKGGPAEPGKPTEAPLQNVEKPPVTAEAEMLTPRLSRQVVEKLDKSSRLPAFTNMTSMRKTELSSPAEAQSKPEKAIKIAKAEPAKKDTAIPRDTRTEGSGKVAQKIKSPQHTAAPLGTATGEQAHQHPAGAIVQGQGSSARSKAATVVATARPSERAFLTPGGATSPAAPSKGTTLPGKDPGTPRATGNHGAIPTPASQTGPGIAPAGSGAAQIETEKSAGTAKPVPEKVEKPKALFHPPIRGDLKLVITGNGAYTVTAAFREFRKSRRSKPFSYREAKNSTGVETKTVRTQEKVMEAVIESTYEGVYDLKLTPGDGAGTSVTLVLKVHESGPGARTKNLGSRVFHGGSISIRVLMPEGILWDDDSYFTGNMEDSDTITKFNSETGLNWREYK